MGDSSIANFQPLPLPDGITEHYLKSKDLHYYYLSAGDPSKPLILCLHGFPELAYSWRKIMPALASNGYHVVAYDQRGYGRTRNHDDRPFHEVDLGTFAFTRLVRDAVIFVNALGYKEVECLISHDFGAVVGAWSALTRGDIFKSVIMMAHPFKGSPSLPFNTVSPNYQPPPPEPNIHEALANLPSPRKHYKWYYSTAPAANDMLNPKADLHTFLRGYFHLKSADWKGNNPKPLQAWSATELATMPYYYVMPFHSTMREAVTLSMANEDPSLVQQKWERWLSDRELDVYVSEWTRTGFQGGLNWYRVATEARLMEDLDVFAGRKIDIPSLFVDGRQDWAMFQEPGVLEKMNDTCSKFYGIEVVDGAGHWVQQEQPERVVDIVEKFLIKVKKDKMSY
ncbi:Alpha/Beta hydrolase protein [Tricladium varicosporioides]|nr:Alpha/Beta hydrolase protein [Hymenoscyphus varicosporioides]